MKKLLFVWGMLCAFTVSAQDMTYGVTGRFGTYKTFVSSSERVGDNNQYGPGLQLELGAWLRWHATDRYGVQVYLTQGIERQSAGAVTAVDQQGHDITDLKTRNGSLFVSATALYLYPYNDRLAIGVGLAGKYRYVDIMVTQKIDFSGRYAEAVDDYDYYANTYNRKLTVHVPLEMQVKLSERLHLVSQVQLSLSNKVIAQESAFKERDLGLTVGVNYTL